MSKDYNRGLAEGRIGSRGKQNTGLASVLRSGLGSLDQGGQHASTTDSLKDTTDGTDRCGNPSAASSSSAENGASGCSRGKRFPLLMSGVGDLVNSLLEADREDAVPEMVW